MTDALQLITSPIQDLLPAGWAEDTVKPWLSIVSSAKDLREASAYFETLETAYRTLDRDTLEITKARRYLEIRIGDVLGEAEVGVNQYSEGSHAGEGWPKNDRLRFRKLAKGKKKIEFVIASSTDSEAISRNNLLRIIKGAHVSNNSGENEWYTPSCYIESAKVVMGKIDLDPASSEAANKVIKAKKYFDEAANGLEQKWKGNIWMNPPYAQPLINDFINKLEIEEYDQAIVLVNNATETKWGQKLLELSNAVCFHQSRIRFVSPDGEEGDAPLQGQMIAYIGPNYKAFISEFKQYGICLLKRV